MMKRMHLRARAKHRQNRDYAATHEMYFELKTVYLENHDQDDEDHHHGGHQHVAHDQDRGRAAGGGFGLDGCGAITARVGDALVVTVGSSIPEKCIFLLRAKRVY